MAEAPSGSDSFLLFQSHKPALVLVCVPLRLHLSVRVTARHICNLYSKNVPSDIQAAGVKFMVESPPAASEPTTYLFSAPAEGAIIFRLRQVRTQLLAKLVALPSCWVRRLKTPGEALSYSYINPAGGSVTLPDVPSTTM